MPHPVCVRCRGPLHTPETAGEWTCDVHGVVEPLHPALPAEPYHLADAASSSGVRCGCRGRRRRAGRSAGSAGPAGPAGRVPSPSP